MPNEKDALNAYESLFGDAEPSAGDAVAEEQDARCETDEDQAGAGEEGADESDQDLRESDISEKQASEDQAVEKEAGSREDLKVVLSIKDGRATVGVQQPSSDPHIERVDAPDLPRLTREVLAVVGRARARWEDAPKNPTHERPAPPARRRPRRAQGSAAQATSDEGGAEQPQPEAPRLF